MENVISVSYTHLDVYKRQPYFLSNENFNKFFICNQYCYLFTSHSVYEFNFISGEVQKVLSLSSDIEATDVILKNNKLFFATSKGIVIKNRKEIGNYPKPKLFINEIQVNGKQGELNKFLVLQPDENDITTVSYTHLDVYKRQSLNRLKLLKYSPMNL